MFRKALLGSVAGLILAVTGASAADIIVKVGPPRPVVERRVVSPGRGYIWTEGYHRWDGGHYVWVPGSWQNPPRRNARWEKARWVHRRDGWVFVEGRWR
jgi:hypothetical protein